MSYFLRLISFSTIIKIKILFTLKSSWRSSHKSCMKFMSEIYGRIKFFVSSEKGTFAWGSQTQWNGSIRKKYSFNQWGKGLFWPTFVLVLFLQLLGPQKTKKWTRERSYQRTIILCHLNYSDFKFGCSTQMAKHNEVLPGLLSFLSFKE